MQEYTVRVYDSHTEWYQNSELHRLDGPAVEFKDGSKTWWKNDKRHRDNGPAVEWSHGHKEWWVNGLLHRLDGPAVEYTDGRKEWWINGVNYTKTDFNAKINPKPTCDGKEVTVEGVKYRLTKID
jgi:hypothetical protein